MSSWLALGGRFLIHWLKAVDEHSLQAPFIYEFYTEVVKNRRFNQSHAAVQALRNSLNSDQTIVQFDDLGAGSQVMGKSTIGRIAKTSHQPKVANLLYSIANRFKPSSVLELGTSLGLTTLNMAASAPDARIFTLEGSHELSNLAIKHFEQLGAKNIHVLVGNIDFTLDQVLDRMEGIDLLFMDANHHYQATMEYFNKCLPKFHENTIVVVDDIHWSGSMEKAWKHIINHPSISLSIDFFYAGVLFLRPELTKSHYILSL